MTIANKSKWHRICQWVKERYEIDRPDADPGILKLRANFEGREAIYLEKGAVRVRVRSLNFWATPKRRRRGSSN